MQRATQDAEDGRLSLIRRGPTYALLGRLGLLAADGSPTAKTGLAFALLAWLPLAVLTLIDRIDGGIAVGPAFLADFNAYARTLIAPLVLVMTERGAEPRLGRLLESFRHAGLVPDSNRAEFRALLETAGRRCEQTLVEALLLVAAYVLSVFAVRHSLVVSGGFWAGSIVDGRAVFTPAGWWLVLVAQPLLMFLVLRWLWRFGAWVALFRSIGRLPLALVATHQDRAGGLGFMTLFPTMFIPFVFALSCVVAASALQEVVYTDMTVRQLGAAAVAWIALVLIICVGPLVTFMPLLMRFKSRLLIEYGEFVARHNREAERVLAAAPTSQLPGAAPISSICDIGAGLDTIRQIKPIPVDLTSVLALAITAAIPMLPVAAVEVPIVELLKKILGALV